MTKGPLLRDIVYEILMEILEHSQYSHLILSRALSKYQYLEKADRSFIKRIVDGTVEYRLQIDHILNLYSRVKVEKMKPAIRTILRLSVYQLLYLDRVPDFAVCSEAVKLAEKRGFWGLKGFVNGLLRTIARERGTLVFSDASIRFSMPGWILDLWTKEYGKETAERICGSFLEDRPLMVRCNQNRASREAVLKSLQEQGVTAEEAGLDGNVLILSGVDYPEALDAFKRGWIQIQDVSSSLAGDAAGIREGDVILDVCGAPGGKGIHAADLLKGTGLVVIRDISGRKVRLIEENILRSGFPNVRAEVWDALDCDPQWEGRADVVIADLPCSGLGIIGRKPDIKYNAAPERLEELAALQREILGVVWRYVKPGGTLVYSTCTIDRKENEDIRSWFLEEYPFEPVDIRGRLGAGVREESLKDGYIQLLPGIHPCDGFFAAVMQRKKG